MDERRAREILGIPEGSPEINDGRKVDWICWPLHGDRDSVGLDGDYAAEQLEAIAWWMKNMPPAR